MAHYQFIIAYDGTHFEGSQRQAEKRTVQLVLEEALRSLGWSERSIVLSGRTDSGVHAAGQVASCTMAWKHGCESLKRALNAALPDDVAIHAVTEVAESFHPRFDAIARTYRYRILAAPDRNPLWSRYSWQVWPVGPLALLQSAAALFVGKYDFSGFGGPTSSHGTTVREVFVSSWSKNGEMLEYLIAANGFLYHMVRRIVYAQIALVQGKVNEEELADLIHRPQKICFGMAPACGLCLEKVSYDKNEML